MKQLRLVPPAFLGAALFVIGCSGPTPSSSADKATIASQTMASLDAFRSDDPSLQGLMDKSVGYAVFPEVGKAGFIAGGSYGKGEVFEGGAKIGYADITQATLGLQIGGQTFEELVLFLRPGELAEFKGNEFDLTGNVSAVAIKAGAAGATDTSKGVVIFVRAKGGLMAEASVGGQRFRYHALHTPKAAAE